MPTRSSKIRSLFFSLIPFGLVGCGTTADVTSGWNNGQVVIDGSAKEWNTGLTELKDSHIFIGTRNDQDYFYLCLMTPEDQFRRQMMIPGLTIWFEPENGKKLGILYPMGIQSPESPAPLRSEGSRDPEDRSRMEQFALQDLEILGPEKEDRNLLSTLQLPGISVKIGSSQGETVYELKIPLHRTTEHPYALEGAGNAVKLAIETGKFEPRMRQGNGEREGGGGTGGGFPGGGRMGRGRFGGGRMGGGRPGGENGGTSRPEPLDLTVEVHLAAQSSQSRTN